MVWVHKNAYQYVSEVNKFYRKPDIFAKDKGGVAIWYPKKNERITIGGVKVENVFYEHMCRDESVKHLCPSVHYDFFYSFIKIKLDPDRFKDILILSGSVGYDPLKMTLYARCGSIEANIATLYTAVKMNKRAKNYDIETIQKNKVYAKHIRETRDPNKVLNMYKYLLKNVDTNLKSDGYFKLAFPDKC